MKNSFSKERLEFIAENVSGILWEADAETFAFTYVSSQSKDILGYPPEAWYQDSSFWKEHIHPEDREQTVAFCHRKTEENEDHEFEYRMIDDDGNVVWLRDLITVQRKEDGSKVLTGLMIDITDQRSQRIQKEEVLKKSYELADIGHWEVDLVNETLYWSQKVKKLHEVDPDYKPDLETAIEFYEEGEHRKTIREAVNDAIESGGSYELELKIITAEGNPRWIRTVGETVMEDGHCVKLFGSTQDITKRKSAELQLKETEKKYRSILENSTILFYRHDTDHNLTYVSPQAKEFLGVEPGDELEAWTDYLTDHPVNTEAIAKTNTAIETGVRQPPYEIQLQKKSGERIWVQVNEAPVIEEGKTIAIVGSLTDITKQKENKQKLERLSRVARETQNIVIITDPKERITWVNKAFEKITGYTLEEAEGKNPGKLLQGSKTDSKTVKRVARQISRQEPFSEQILNYNKEGTPYWIEMDIMPIKNNDGEIEEFFAIQEVITEQVRRKQQLEEQSKRLEEAQHIANVGDWHFDVESGDIRWSDMTYEIFERDKDLSPPSFEELIDSYKTDYPQGLKKLVNHAIEQNEKYDQDFEIRTEKGNRKYIKTRGIPITNDKGEVIALRGIVQDITKRKKAELELQEQISISESILDSLPGLFYMMDEDLNFVRLNNNAYNFFGLSLGEDQQVDPLSLIAPRERTKVKQKIGEVFDNGYAEIETVMVSGKQEYNFFINGKLLELGNRKYILGNGINITDRVKTQRKNRVLLQEIHHRVKNNLAIISGLLSMEMEEFENDDAKLSFQRSINRIHSMAKVHELLYDTEDFSSVNIAQYLRELSSIIQTTFDQTQTVDIDIDVDQIDMNINEAIPLGMLMNELLTNSLKYAFGDEGGNITVQIEKRCEGYRVIYRDNGRGMASKPDLASADSLGFIIIYTLLQQLEADFELDVDKKFQLVLTFGRRMKGSHSTM